MAQFKVSSKEELEMRDTAKAGRFSKTREPARYVR